MFFKQIIWFTCMESSKYDVEMHTTNAEMYRKCGFFDGHYYGTFDVFAYNLSPFHVRRHDLFIQIIN